jgi:hypothetical protein
MIMTEHLIQRRAPANAVAEFAEVDRNRIKARWFLITLSRCRRRRNTLVPGGGAGGDG